MVLLAMFVVAVPATAVAQSPLSDQYQTDEAVPGAAGNNAGDAVAVTPKTISREATEGLPFTGGQIALIALLGLGLVALGAVGVATTRRRGSPSVS